MSERAFPLICSCCAGLFPAFRLFSRLSRPVGLSAIIIFFTNSHPRQPKKLLSLHKTVCISAIKRAYCTRFVLSLHKTVFISAIKRAYCTRFVLSLHKTVFISAIKRVYCIKPYSRYGKSWTQEIDANTEL